MEDPKISPKTSFFIDRIIQLSLEFDLILSKQKPSRQLIDEYLDEIFKSKICIDAYAKSETDRNAADKAITESGELLSCRICEQLKVPGHNFVDLMKIIEKLNLSDAGIRCALLSDNVYELRAAYNAIALKHEFKPNNNDESIGFFIGGAKWIIVDKDLLLKRLFRMMEASPSELTIEELGKTRDKRIIPVLYPIAIKFGDNWKASVLAIAELGNAGYEDLRKIYQKAPKPYTEYWQDWNAGGTVGETEHDEEQAFMLKILSKFRNSY